MAKKAITPKDKRNAQNTRTLRNVAKRRLKHSKAHPNDVDHVKMVPIRRKNDDNRTPTDWAEVNVKGSISNAKRWVK